MNLNMFLNICMQILPKSNGVVYGVVHGVVQGVLNKLLGEVVRGLVYGVRFNMLNFPESPKRVVAKTMTPHPWIKRMDYPKMDHS